jgi:hypothetical protein
MAYAEVSDVESRCRRVLSDADKKICESFLEDAAIIVDAYNKEALSDTKKLVSCSMVVRAIGTDDSMGTPIGASQGTVSAMGYSQSWTMNSGSTGELYLSKIDKRLLGVGNRVGFSGPLEDIT